MEVSRVVELLGLHATAGSDLYGLYCWMHEKHVLDIIELEIVEVLIALPDDATVEDIECSLCGFYQKSTEQIVEDCIDDIEKRQERGRSDAPLKSNDGEDIEPSQDNV